MHRGPYSKIPGTPAGSEIDLSSSGRVVTSPPWYRSKWMLFLPVGIVAWLIFWPLLLQGGTWVLVCALLVWLIYRTWRPV